VNQADEAMLKRLRSSIQQFGFVAEFVVPRLGDGMEVLSVTSD